MARRGKTGLQHVKSTFAKGRYYYYFNTGKVDEKGKAVFVPLPDPRDPSFGGKYAALLGHRNRGASAPVMTVSKMVAMYENSPHFKGLADGTQRIYGIYLAQFVADFGPAQPDMLERQDIAFAIDKRASTPGAANSLLKSIRALYLWARRRGHLNTDPCKDIQLLDVGEHDPWPDDLLAKALTCEDDRVRLAVHLLYYTAQRIGDVAPLRWTAITNGSIFVKQKKTGAELDIPLHRDLAVELEQFGKQSMSIIPGVNGRPLSDSRLRESIQEWAAGQGHKVVPHGLRKNAVNALLEAGCSVPQAASISGQSMQLVEYYAKKRSQKTLAKSAIIKWERGSKEQENGA